MNSTEFYEYALERSALYKLWLSSSSDCVDNPFIQHIHEVSDNVPKWQNTQAHHAVEEPPAVVQAL